MDRNILLISEKDQKAYLPYYFSEVEKAYRISEKNYHSIQEVIEDLYVLPLERFKNFTIARFRETLNLVIHKEKGSIISALDLALELMFQYKLNPIIIAACRNLEELDIYLDCLEEEELFDFNCFEIKFEVAPAIYSKQMKEFYQ